MGEMGWSLHFFCFLFSLLLRFDTSALRWAGWLVLAGFLVSWTPTHITLWGLSRIAFERLGWDGKLDTFGFAVVAGCFFDNNIDEGWGEGWGLGGLGLVYYMIGKGNPGLVIFADLLFFPLLASAWAELTEIRPRAKRAGYEVMSVKNPKILGNFFFSEAINTFVYETWLATFVLWSENTYRTWSSGYGWMEQWS